MPIPERPQALQRQSAKSVVYQTVCDWIITGVMKPGEKILDSELASYFNVSRTPVREALQLLQNQKLVCVIPGRTTVVADLDVEDFEKCYRPLAEIVERLIRRTAPFRNWRGFEGDCGGLFQERRELIQALAGNSAARAMELLAAHIRRGAAAVTRK